MRVCDTTEPDKNLTQAHQGTELLALLSHEMKSPLTAISALTSLMLTEKAGVLSPLQREFLTSIRFSSGQLTRLAENILDLYLAEVGQFRIFRGQVCLANVAASAMEQLGHVASGAGVRLESELDLRLSPVTGDRRRLEQVLVSLLETAIRWGAQGGLVNISAEDLGAELRVVVRAHRTEEVVGADNQPCKSLWNADEPNNCACASPDLGLRVANLILEHHGSNLLIEPYASTGISLSFRILVNGL